MNNFDNKAQFKQKKFYQNAKPKKISKNLKITERVALLKKYCPTYDNSINLNDNYRIEKALKYAIASDGKFFNSDLQLSIS